MTKYPTTMDVVGDTDLVITRVLRARQEIVFDAFTKPEYVRRWWAPASRGVTIITCEADVRPGGAYLYVLSHGPTDRFSFFGSYLEVERPARLVYTQGFDPSERHDSNVAEGEAAVVTVSFEDQDGLTKLVSRERYPSRAVRDQVLASGMEDGMRETFEQLDELVASLAAR